MQTSSRNVAVGLFVIVALGLLGWLIVKFGGQPRLLRNTYSLTMQFPTAGTVTDGSELKLGGVTVGHVRSIKLIRNGLGGVQIVAEIDNEYSIPKNSVATITAGGVGLGNPVININVMEDAAPVWLPKDGSAKLEGKVVSQGLIPPEMQRRFDELTVSLKRVADDMHDLLVPLNDLGQPVSATQPETNLSVAVRRLNSILEQMSRQLREGGDVKVTLANLRQVSANAITLTETMQEFTRRAVVVADSANQTFQAATTQVDRIGQAATSELRRIGESLTANSLQLSKSLATLNKIMTDIDAGRGTLGRLVNDPRLFESMVLTMDRLHQAVIDLQRLVQEWQREGVGIKLK